MCYQRHVERTIFEPERIVTTDSYSIPNPSRQSFVGTNNGAITKPNGTAITSAIHDPKYGTIHDPVSLASTNVDTFRVAQCVDPAK
jgi:hypothetical protein